MKIFTIQKGQRQRILRKRFSNMPQTMAFTVEPVHPGDSVTGKLTIDRTTLVFRKPLEAVDLKTQHQLEKSWWSTFYKVFVEPDCDVEVTITRGQDRLDVVWLFGLVVILAFVAVGGMALLRAIG